MEEARAFLTKQVDESVRQQALASLRTLLEHTLHQGGCSAADFIDLCVKTENGVLSVSTRDMGKPFDLSDPANKSSLALDAVDEIGYRYAFHQNSQVLHWKLN